MVSVGRRVGRRGLQRQTWHVSCLVRFQPAAEENKIVTSMIAALFGLVGFGLLYWFAIRRWLRSWGATSEEIVRTMPGDSDVPDAIYRTTLAITIDAPPSAIWPWLVQMGYRRGGLYSYDWLDRACGFLDAPSAGRILPECQRLQVGDVIPVGRGQGFPVKMLDPLRTLVLGGESDGVHWMWQLALYPIDAGHTRLVSRNRGDLPRTVGSILFIAVLELAAFVMTRKMLLGLKRRAEVITAEGERVATNAV